MSVDIERIIVVLLIPLARIVASIFPTIALWRRR